MAREDQDEKIIKTGAFANVNKQIGNMKTDHIRGKIFKRHGKGKLLLPDSIILRLIRRVFGL